MKLRETAAKVIDILAKEYPAARVTLDFSNPLELLVATILAAQCTDERVNRVTQDLFRKYRASADYARADQEKFEEEIRSTGFFRNKAKNILLCCRKLVTQFHGQVPQTLEELTSLPGVGRKTANIILGNAFGKQAIAVDTHVKRVTHRLGWAKSEDPDKIEFELMEVMPPERWTLACHQLVFHGRKICMAKNPQCPVCPVAKYCPRIGVSRS
ncbi:MAG: endonuclease [Deltaproteobacteria bacterium]|nr:endonuclease [Deltaproteobacteria bacterium]